MRPPTGRGDADSHLWPCPQCGTANGLNALACWNCEVVLTPVPPEELPAPISASLAERGILERVADLRETDPSREMALATEEAEEEDAWTAARSSDRWARAGRGIDSRNGAPDATSAPRPSNAAPAEPPTNGAERRASPRPVPPADSPHHRSVEAFLALWTQPDDEPAPADPAESAHRARPESPHGTPTGSNHATRSEAANATPSDSAQAAWREQAHLAQPESAPLGQADARAPSDPAGAPQPAVGPAPAGPAQGRIRSEAAAAPVADPSVEASKKASRRGDDAAGPLGETPAADTPPQAADARTESAPAAEPKAPAEQPTLETFEYPAPAGHEHPPIRIDPDDAQAGIEPFSFGPVEAPTGPDSDAFGPLPSARQESDPFHDAALGERFAELAESSARSARRRRRVTLTATGLLLAALAVVAYSIFEDGVRVDLSADELRSAAARSTATAPTEPTKPATEPTAPPVTSMSQAAPPSPARTTAPVPAPVLPSRTEPAGRATAPVDAAPPAAPPPPVAAARPSRTPPPAVIERFERSRPVAANTTGATTPEDDAARAERPGEAKGGDDNTSITCTERILALGLCGPEPSRRKE